ncbi:MAG: phosphate ABC transporter ATP-binding protein [Acidimicrobiia bacterium]|jgi:tungstate transport system ATP-binding protein|nr:MAG: phosphate ABC transporter ATP-binding protein [Acidimicrobiia bacterium]
MSTYTLHGLRHAYGDRTVVDIPNLEITEGEVFGIVGPSGAGKSTLLRLLNFLEQSTAGAITFGGHAVPKEPPLEMRRRVTTVFQRPVLLNRSCRENLVFGLRLRDRDPDPGAVEEWIVRLGLEDLADAPARTLSGGEAQRVAIARALLVEPDALLLDEPTSNLDPHNVARIERLVSEVRSEQRTTVVLVTHNVHQARRLADRVGLMIGGRMVEVAPTEEFFESPKEEKTAAFLRGDLVY